MFQTPSLLDSSDSATFVPEPFSIVNACFARKGAHSLSAPLAPGFRLLAPLLELLFLRSLRSIAAIRVTYFFPHYAKD